MMTNVSAAACKHLTEKLMRSGVWGVEPPKGLDWVVKSEAMTNFRRYIAVLASARHSLTFAD